MTLLRFAGLLALAGAGLASAGAPAPEAAKSITLPVVPVAMKRDIQVRTYPARVTPIARVAVVPQVSGEILDVTFENGALVKEGDLLYQIDPVKYEAAEKNAEAKVAECRANLSYTELSYARHKKLVSSHAVSLDAVDNALSSRDSARASLAAAEADLVKARDDLKHCRITAPISGKIGTTLKTKGNYVREGVETLVSIVQAAPIRVRFTISNRDYLNLFGGRNRIMREEAKIKVMLSNGETLDETGAVEYVDNETDEQTDTVQVFAIFPNEKSHLKPGGTVELTLTSDKGVMRPAVPPTAVLQDTQGPYVWVVAADGRAQRRTIARGDMVGDFMFVEKGLRAGERIVADGAHRVRRGMKIENAK